MSPPPAGWRIVGGANYKSAANRGATNPRRAASEWLALADAIEAAGHAVCVLPPPPAPQLLTGLMYTANAGWLLAPDRFRIARLSVPHRQAERAYLQEALATFGWTLEQSATVWEGQADMCTLSGGDGRPGWILSYGVRSEEPSVKEVTQALPVGASVEQARLRQPFFHGDTCMDVVESPSGPLWLVFPGAFADGDAFRRARAFADRFAEVVELSEADALGYACNSLSLGERLLVPTGLSDELLARLQQRGVEPLPLDFAELFGRGGGGPRCLVNELRGIEAPPAGTAFAAQRAGLAAAFAAY